MDALGLLAAVVAVTLFPGGVYAFAAAGGAAVAGRLPAARLPWTSAHAGAAALLLFAAALVPLPQAPAAALPAPDGAPSNLLAVLLLLGGGITAGTLASWTRARIAAATAAVAPLLVLAAAAATLSLPVVVALPGRELAAARAPAGVVEHPRGGGGRHDPGRDRALRGRGRAGLASGRHPTRVAGCRGGVCGDRFDCLDSPGEPLDKWSRAMTDSPGLGTIGTHSSRASRCALTRPPLALAAGDAIRSLVHECTFPP